MTQDEVNQIYDYLHEYYEYKEGELVCKKDVLRGKKKGDKLGWFYYSDGCKPSMRTLISINKKKKVFKVAVLIYIFHHKKLNGCIVHIDNNPLNNNIENLKVGLLGEVQHKVRAVKDTGIHTIKNKNGTITYAVILNFNKLKGRYGTYVSYEQAKEVSDFVKSIFRTNFVSVEETKKAVAKKFPFSTLVNRNFTQNQLKLKEKYETSQRIPNTSN